MKKWFWIDGRFSWRFIVAVVYVTLWLLTVDFAWLVLVLPIGTLLIYAVVIGIALALMIAFIARRKRRTIG